MLQLTNNRLNLTFPKWVKELLNPYRFKIVYGGRGSGKSYAIADILLIKSLEKQCLIVCGREFQNSIKDSVHSLLKRRIEALGFSKYFQITRDEIRCKYSASRFIFKGMRNNIDSIKSMAGITHLWIEEADTLSAESWKVIKPTIREEGSEIFITMNPKNKTDILYREFVEPEETPEDTYRVKINYVDNPHFPSVLNAEMKRDKARDHGYYLHVWEGECLEHSHAQIFKNKWDVVAEEDFIEPEDMYPYYGLDFGFSQDPTAGIRCFVNDNDNKLYITHEAVKIGLEIDHTLAFLEEHLPDVMNYTIYADNARPESISFLKRQGLSIKAVEKGKGSIEDGLEYIKSFDGVVIHERCVETINEFTLYSYKVDERSGDITNKIVDKYNDLTDSLRYALERSMKKGKSPTLKQLDTFDKSMDTYYEEKKYKSLFGY
jgi:phage terminase large subunit